MNTERGTFGPAYDERLDGARLRTQMHRVRDYMLTASGWAARSTRPETSGLEHRYVGGKNPFRLPDGHWTWGGWRTLADISTALEIPQASASAQLRHLRKPKLCEQVLGLPAGQAYRVEKRRMGESRSPSTRGLAQGESRIDSGVWEYRVLPPVEQEGAEQRPLFKQELQPHG